MGSVAIHQPNYIPRLKVLQKLAYSDIWVVLSNVQYAQREWQNRTKIFPYRCNKRSFWLTLPVSLPDGRKTHIGSIEVKGAQREIARCNESIRHAFRSAPYWSEVKDYWGEVQSSIVSSKLIDFVMPTMVIALRRYARTPEIIDAKTLQIRGMGSALMASICEEVECKTYLADSGSMNYLDVNDFRAQVVWQEWIEPLHCDLQISWRDISFLSFLAFYGPEALRDHLMSGTFGRMPVELSHAKEGGGG